MKFNFPYSFEQSIILNRDGRETKVLGFRGTIFSDGTFADYFKIETKHGLVDLSDIKTEPSKNIYDISVGYEIGSNVLLQDTNKGYDHIIENGEVDSIRFDITRYNNLFWYGIVGRGLFNKASIYGNIQAFKNRTKPKRKLSEGEIYMFMACEISQRYIVPIVVEERTSTHSMYRGNEIKNCCLYTSVEEFNNRMLAQVK